MKLLVVVTQLSIYQVPSYQEVNITVFITLQELIVDTQHMYCIKPHQHLRDGRVYFMELNLHNMGS